MKFVLNKLSPQEWSKMSEDVHKLTFDKVRPASFDRINFALFVHDGQKPCGFATIIEQDKAHAYMQEGGGFPGTVKSIIAVKVFFMIINWLKINYTTISCQTKNHNLPMIKMALAAGFLISGTELNEGNLYLKLLWKKRLNQP